MQRMANHCIYCLPDAVMTPPVDGKRVLVSFGLLVAPGNDLD